MSSEQFPAAAPLRSPLSALRFPQAFSWIVYKSRADRDRVNAKVMADPRLAKMAGKPMPFDPQRMTYGGFEVLVSL